MAHFVLSLRACDQAKLEFMLPMEQSLDEFQGPLEFQDHGPW